MKETEKVEKMYEVEVKISSKVMIKAANKLTAQLAATMNVKDALKDFDTELLSAKVKVE